jgi:hypothetical protein
MQPPGSLCPQRTVRAGFPAYSSDIFKAFPAKGPRLFFLFLLAIKIVICLHFFALPEAKGLALVSVALKRRRDYRLFGLILRFPFGAPSLIHRVGIKNRDLHQNGIKVITNPLLLSSELQILTSKGLNEVRRKP